tara:strand:- start:45 stop:434 length:390 start_codon:yes stop_codon:yes gene_type:complete
MKKKIVILGSTGSIGKTTTKLLEKDKKNFNIILLTADKNYVELIKQAKKLKPKNIIINDASKIKYLKKKLKRQKIKIFLNIKNLKKIVKKKVDYTMCAISGLVGLAPTLEAISFSKNIAIANKESIVCA